MERGYDRKCKKNHFKTIWGGKFVIFWIWKFWKFKSIIVLHFLQYLCLLFLFGIHFGVIMGVWSLFFEMPKTNGWSKIRRSNATSYESKWTWAHYPYFLYLNVRKAHWGNSEKCDLECKREISFIHPEPQRKINKWVWSTYNPWAPRMMHYANQAHVEN